MRIIEYGIPEKVMTPNTLNYHFPRSLDGAPAVLPAGEMGLRRQLEHWFQANSIQPRVIAEVEDTALLTDLGPTASASFRCIQRYWTNLRVQSGFSRSESQRV
jgi:hypothetical protein